MLRVKNPAFLRRGDLRPRVLHAHAGKPIGWVVNQLVTHQRVNQIRLHPAAIHILRTPVAAQDVGGGVAVDVTEAVKVGFALDHLLDGIPKTFIAAEQRQQLAHEGGQLVWRSHGSWVARRGHRRKLLNFGLREALRFQMLF